MMLQSLLRTSMRVASASTSAPCNFRQFHTTSIRRDLSEFFDHPDNFDKSHVRVGRSWRQDELRLKSNQDLHKLWFVLLKERNMLLTMEHEYRAENERMPNPERIDKVDESMENLESVVRERNRAFWELEVGSDGEPKREIISGPFGLDVGYHQKEHLMPKENNQRWRGFMNYRYRTKFGPDVRNFYRKYREQEYRKLWLSKFKQLRLAAKAIGRFPNTDPEALEEKYPMVSYEEAKRYFEARGHRRNEDLER